MVLTVAENERSQFFENETLNSDIRFFKEASILIGTRLYPVYSEMLYMGTGLALCLCMHYVAIHRASPVYSVMLCIGTGLALCLCISDVVIHKASQIGSMGLCFRAPTVMWFDVVLSCSMGDL